MADHEYPFTSSGTPQSYPLDASNAAGVTVIDEVDNVRVVKAERLASGVYLLTLSASDAQVSAAVKAYAIARGLVRDGPGGIRNVQGDGRTTLTGTNVAAAD